MHRAWSTLEIKSINQELGVIEGIASTPTTDRMGDIVEPKGAKFKLPIPLLYQHNASMPIGLVTAAKVTSAGIAITAEIAKGVLPMIDDAWALIKAGLVRGLSIGFTPIDDPVPIKGTYGVKFTTWEWLELSAVTIPANADASIQMVKSIDETQMRAASGQTHTVVTKPPGASGIKTSLKGTTVEKTTQEQLGAAEAKRAANAARMKAIADEATAKGETMDDAAGQEFDELETENGKLDTHIKRLRSVEKQIVAAAVPVRQVVEGNGEQAETESKAARSGVIQMGKSNLPQAMGFARYAMAIGKAKGNLMQAAEISKQWNDTTPEVGMSLKAAVAAGTTTDSTWAAPLALPNTLASEFIEFLRPMTLLGRIQGLRRVPFNIRFPRGTSGASGSWTGEGLAKPVSKMAFETLTMGFTKITSLVVLTDELVRFSNPSAEVLIRDDMAKAISQYMDQQFIDPTVTASAGVRPASITNGLTQHASTGAGSPTLAQLDTDMNTLFSGMINADIQMESPVFIMNPRTALYLSTVRTTNGPLAFPEIGPKGGTFKGVPVVASRSVPIESGDSTIIVLIDAAQILVADDGAVTVDFSSEASLQMDSAPAAGAQSMVSLWQNNLFALRAERYVNWTRRHDAAVQILDSVLY